MQQKIKNITSSYFGVKFARFAIVGVGNSIVDIGVFNLIILSAHPLGRSVISLYVVARVIAGLCAITNSYLWNRLWVFKDTQKVSKTAVPFLLVSGVGIVISTAMFHAFFISMSLFLREQSPLLIGNIAILLAISFSILWNFFGYTFFVFKPEVEY